MGEIKMGDRILIGATAGSQFGLERPPGGTYATVGAHGESFAIFTNEAHLHPGVPVSDLLEEIRLREERDALPPMEGTFRDYDTSMRAARLTDEIRVLATARIAAREAAQKPPDDDRWRPDITDDNVRYVLRRARELGLLFPPDGDKR